MAKAAMAIVICLLMAEAMAQPNCDFIKIARTYVETHFPFIHLASKRRVVTAPVGAYWQGTFDFDEPARYLGMVPEITVDPGACQVVSAKVWQ